MNEKVLKFKACCRVSAIEMVDRPLNDLMNRNKHNFASMLVKEIVKKDLLEIKERPDHFSMSKIFETEIVIMDAMEYRRLKRIEEQKKLEDENYDNLMRILRIK